MNTSIKAVCFDLDGVYFTSKGKNSFHQALVNEYGAQKEVVDELMYRSAVMAQLVRGQIEPKDFWDQFRKITGINASDEELAACWIRDYEVDTDVKRAVLKAKELGYKTCVCTNNNAIRLNPLIEKFGLSKDFDCIVSSHEIGYTKPSIEIFEALLGQLGIKPSELVYSDDNPARLTGASELGIKTFVFENFDQFIAELEKLGVNIK